MEVDIDVDTRMVAFMSNRPVTAIAPLRNVRVTLTDGAEHVVTVVADGRSERITDALAAVLGRPVDYTRDVAAMVAAGRP